MDPTAQSRREYALKKKLLCVCALCGYPFYTGEPGWRWERACRAFYATKPDWSDGKISGIGGLLAVTPTSFGSTTASVHEQYSESGGIQPFMNVALIYRRREEALPFPKGFGVHESCFKVLQAACHPYKLDDSTFPAFCRSYGPIAALLIRRRKWTNLNLQNRDWYHPLQGKTFEAELPISLCDPLQESIRFRIWIDQSVPPRGNVRDVHTPGPCTRDHPHTDVLSKLPHEILEQVMMELPWKDVSALQKASCAAASVSLSQRFYASRFHVGSDLGAIFEIRTEALPAGCYRDYRHLFHRLSSLRRVPNDIKNRFTVWQKCQPFAQAFKKFCEDHNYEADANVIRGPLVYGIDGVIARHIYSGRPLRLGEPNGW